MNRTDDFSRKNGSIEIFLKEIYPEIILIISNLGSQLNYLVNWLQLSINESLLVIPAGVEPTTHRLEICCSIQLSYGININTSRGRQIRTADLHVPNVAR